MSAPEVGPAPMQADIFYVPIAARMDFALAAGALEKSGLHYEIVMAALLGIITDVDGQVDIMPVHIRLLPDLSFTADNGHASFPAAIERAGWSILKGNQDSNKRLKREICARPGHLSVYVTCHLVGASICTGTLLTDL